MKGVLHFLVGPLSSSRQEPAGMLAVPEASKILTRTRQ
jgi:hypothetical protein